MIEWLEMGGYGYFVWSSYGALAIAVAIELGALRRRTRQARATVRRAIEEEAQ
ncbi:MAG: heme exporter protein CcmD [Burkholderiaceae bacterium]|nr:heme exporter protein CcmD [Burkholderiaceae bacterium]